MAKVYQKIKFFSVVLVFVSASALLYTIGLGGYPPSVHCDEILPTLYGRSLISKGISSLIGISWFDIPNLVFWPYGIVNSIFGNNIFAARLPSAIMGTLTIVPLFFLIKTLFNQRVAIISTFLLIFSHWWMASSRSGIINIQTVLPEILSFYFILRGFKENRTRYIGLAGISTGLGMYLYLNFRIVPLIILALFAHEFIFRVDKKVVIKYFITWLTAAFIVFLPMLSFYVKSPQSFLSRSTITFIFSNDPSIERHMTSVYGTNDRKIWLINNAKKALDLSESFKDDNWQYGYKGKPLEPITLIFFLIGLIIALSKLKRIENYFIIIWFWFTYIVLGILTVNIALPRLVGLLPAIFIFPALAIDSIIRTVSQKIRTTLVRQILKTFTVSLLLTIALINIKIYFIDNPKNGLPIFNKNIETKLAEYYYVDNYKHKVILVTEPYILPDWCLIPLISPKLNPISLKNGGEIPNIIGPKIFAVLKNYPNMLKKIREKYPLGTLNELGEAYIYSLEK